MKYKLTDETMTTESGVLLHRIECVCSFGNVKAGDRGGWIEKEENLSQLCDCWVYGKAWVYGNAYVTVKELIEKAYKDSKLSGDCYKAYVELVEKLKEQQKQ